MAFSWKDLSEEQLYGEPSRLTFDVLGAWVDFHQYASLYYGPEFRVKPLKPTVRADSYRLGMILCRGIAASQVADVKTDFNRAEYEFMVAAKCIRVGMRPANMREVQGIYEELKGKLSLSQKFWFLHTFVAIAYEGKGEAKLQALDYFISQSTVLEFEPDHSTAFPCDSSLYSLWRGFLGDEPGPKLSASQRQLLETKVASFEGTKVAKTYERNRKRFLRNAN
ncbi:MAG TPA: hypothetical protein VK171_12310 [Fimbriimonas sp.]|nr:hypothetical protein [Fimbriimonas sp.]